MPSSDGYKNLVSLADRTTEERREIAVKAGKASGVARKEKRLLKDICLELLQNEKIVPAEVRQRLQAAGIPCDAGGAILLAQIAKAADGDTRAAEYVRDTAGQMPVRAVSLQVPQSDAEMQQLSDADLQELAGE